MLDNTGGDNLEKRPFGFGLLQLVLPTNRNNSFRFGLIKLLLESLINF